MDVINPVNYRNYCIKMYLNWIIKTKEFTPLFFKGKTVIYKIKFLNSIIKVTLIKCFY